MRSPVTVTLTAAGSTNWVPVDVDNAPFSLSLQVIPSSNFSGTAITVQHTYDSLGSEAQRYVTFSQATTTVTITDTGPAFGTTGPGGTSGGHGMATGDSVLVLGTAQQALSQGKVSFDGTYTVTVTNATTYTITVTPSQTFVGSCFTNNLRVLNNATLAAGVTVRTDAQYQFPVRAIRLSAATLTAGSVDMVVNQGIAL